MEYKQFTAIVGALLTVAVIAMVIERALAFVFEHEWFDRVFNKDAPDPATPGKTIRVSKFPGFKGLIALGISYAICVSNNFDVLQAIFGRPDPDPFGIVLTSFVVAGGSAGAVALFQGFLNLGKESRDALIEAKIAEAEAAKKISELRTAEAEAQQETAVIERDVASERKTLVRAEAHLVRSRAVAEGFALDEDDDSSAS